MAVLVANGSGQYRLQGAVTFIDQPPDALWRTPLVPSEGQVTVDLGDLDRSDSVALALLLEWERLARKGSYQFRVSQVPARLQDLMRVSGLAKLFGVS